MYRQLVASYKLVSKISATNGLYHFAYDLLKPNMKFGSHIMNIGQLPIEYYHKTDANALNVFDLNGFN